MTNANMNLTDNQRAIARTLDVAAQVVIAYSAKEVPAIGNLTPEGMLEELGRLNEARKALEKVEKIVRGRLDSQLGGRKTLRSDNFEYTIKTQERTVLNQSKAKETLSGLGILEEHMDTSKVEVRTVKRL